MLNNPSDSMLWLARMVLLSAGGALAQRGYGDAALWDTVVGGLMVILTAVWSYLASRPKDEP
jgi:hypothetical protein